MMVGCPFSVYMPPGTACQITALFPREPGIFSATKAVGRFQVRLIEPKDVATMERGKGFSSFNPNSTKIKQLIFY